MSDNIIVKTVAGTCVTFSFILAGTMNPRDRNDIQVDSMQETQSLSPT